MAKLYIVPTPIGNLEDITIRAIRILKEVQFILAEDTRTSSHLLRHFEISNKLLPHHKFNEHRYVEQIAQRIAMGENAALISDAGTPSISDPGYLLVKTCVEQNIDVECLPGATALIPALVNSGFPSDKFCFEGFLPQKKGRQKRLIELASETRTLIFYESPFRLLKLLTELQQYFGAERLVSVSRELSKLYEENKRGTISEVAEYFNEKTIKGEIVVVVKGFETTTNQKNDDDN